MRHSLIILVLTLAASVYSITANAYVIHNNTGIDGEFNGGVCLKCFSGRIPNGDTASCPGDKGGCGGTTKVSLYVSPSDMPYFGLKPYISEPCYLETPVPVTAHGDVYFYRYTVKVIDDRGLTLYEGPWKQIFMPRCLNQ